jgi:hypothetical protein
VDEKNGEWVKTKDVWRIISSIYCISTISEMVPLEPKSFHKSLRSEAGRVPYPSKGHTYFCAPAALQGAQNQECVIHLGEADAESEKQLRVCNPFAGNPACFPSVFSFQDTNLMGHKSVVDHQHAGPVRYEKHLIPKRKLCEAIPVFLRSGS